jgi:DNA-binding response OmpR family regulator
MNPETEKKILLLLSDQAIASTLVSKLGEVGYGTLAVHDAPSAASEFDRYHPDLLILDVGASDFDGFAMIESLRSTGELWQKELPIIIASNNGDLMEISKGLHLGIKDYFVKTSFTPDQIISKIAKQIGPAHEPSMQPQMSAVQKSEQKIRVLMVEDDKFLRDLAAQKMAKENLDVTTAMDGEQGLSLAEKNIPNIILLDILLPGIDGYEVLRRIRLNPALASTHVAMLSNFGQREDVERALKGGADHFLVKANYTLDEVVQEVKRIVAKPRGQGN